MKITREYISLLLKHDRKTQHDLYKRCYGLMLGISKRYQKDAHEAQDAVNRSFLKVLKSLGEFDNSRDLSPWVARITINVNLDACRKQQKLRAVFSQEAIEDININISQYNDAIENIKIEELMVIINLLPSTTKEVFNLYVIDGYKHREIGHMLNISEGTSKWHLNSARKKIKITLAKVDEQEKVIQYGK